MVVARKVLGAAITAAFLSFVSAASAGERIGNCEISGTKAAYQLVPARPDRLTVQVHLPAPVWWNGDTSGRIARGSGNSGWAMPSRSPTREPASGARPGRSG